MENIPSIDNPTINLGRNQKVKPSIQLKKKKKGAYDTTRVYRVRKPTTSERNKGTVMWPLHTPAEDLEHDRSDVYSQQTDTGINDDLGQDCQDG